MRQRFEQRSQIEEKALFVRNTEACLLLLFEKSNFEQTRRATNQLTNFNARRNDPRFRRETA